LKVAAYYGNRDVRLEERPVPKVSAGELLMRIEASGICGSDVMEWYRLPKAPVVLGHEVAGVVVESGEGVKRFKQGDRIVTTHHVPCNACRYCKTDRHAVCETLRSTSFDPGGFSELVRLPAINVERGTFALPEKVGFEEATFVEPLACVIRALRLSRIRPGDSVVVLGSGISGTLMIQMARYLGAGRIVATDVSPWRLDAAIRFGADLALPAAGPKSVEQLIALNDGRGYEQVLVCTSARAAIEQAPEITDLGGTVLYFAPLDPGETISLDMNELWKRGVNIIHSYAGPPADMRAAIDLLAAGRIDVASMITHRLPLADTAEGFRLMLEEPEALKIIIEPQQNRS
jgi:L-iditol 2-dehydrogenase